MSDNILSNRGKGSWIFHLYTPEKEVGPYYGILLQGKDFHIVVDSQNTTKTIASIASPNIAYCYNAELIRD